LTDELPDIPFRQVQNADGRRREVRLYRALRRQLLSDMGGAEDIPATRLAVVETLAMAAAIQRAEFIAIIDDPSRDPSRFAALGNLVLGAARTLGMKRIPKDVPSLAQYLAAHAERAQDARPATQETRSAATPADGSGGAADA
jgi:hypothetical protein